MAEIDAKAAVSRAVAYVNDMYSDARITDVLLEEIQMNEGEKSWLITVGFSLLQSLSPALMGADVARMFSLRGDRVYKVVEVDRSTGAIRSMKIREMRGNA